MNRSSRRAYSLIAVLTLLTLLGIALVGLLFFIAVEAQTSSSMIDRRRSFYACDGVGRQLARLGQAFLSRNTEEDVSETAMQTELRGKLSLLVPEGFSASTNDLVIPEKPLPIPVPVETISTGPFAGMQVRIQNIDMSMTMTRPTTGAVCRSEQTLALGRIALFQFFVFADLPLLDVVPVDGESVFLRGRIHTNGRVCLGGGFASLAEPPALGRFAVRLDSRVTAVERVLQAADGRCGLNAVGLFPAGITNSIFRGEQLLPVQRSQDRLFNPGAFDPLRDDEDSGCVQSPLGCAGGWRAYTIRHWLARVQDTDHEVQELTLPLDPPALHVQKGFVANGDAVAQVMQAGPSRPNTRFLVEPAVTNDPTGFARNKMATKAQLRIIDGVWYVKDPGGDNDPRESGDDGPWPGIPVWSDHPGEYRTNTTDMTAEGIEGTRPLDVGQSNIRADLEQRALTDARLANARWSRRATLSGVPPTPRRFSYYAFVDRRQADDDANLSTSRQTLLPPGPGLQWGRVCARSSGSVQCDIDPPAVVSYGAIARVDLGNGSDEQPYWQPGFRMTSRETSQRRSRHERDDTPWCGRRSEEITLNEIEDGQVHSAVPPPIAGSNSVGLPLLSDFPMPGSPLPGDGDASPSAGNPPSAWVSGRLCENDDEEGMRRRARLALLEGTRTGFFDHHAQGPGVFHGAQGNVLPVNIDLHALQEALADQTPGELGSYFCAGCLWERFDGTIFVSNSWQGAMLGVPFPNELATPIPSSVVDNERGPSLQPRAPKETLSTTGPLPYELCASPSVQPATALAQVVGQRFVEADEFLGTGSLFSSSALTSTFIPPYANDASDHTEKGYFRFFDEAPHATPEEEAPTQVPPVQDRATAIDPDPSSGAHAVPSDKMAGSFFIPDCAKYSLTKTDGVWRNVRATAVRVINARVINFNAARCGNGRNDACLPKLSSASSSGAEPATGRLSRGLNVVTNLPLYITGDVNLTSEVDQVETGKRATNWVPVMFAGDTVTTLSNAWDDQQSRWGVDTGDDRLIGTDRAGETLRSASTTRYHMLLLTGLVAAGVGDATGITALSRSGGGLQNAMRLLENWSDRDVEHIFRGALVLGFAPVYTQWRTGNASDRTYRPPRLRDWQFDRHLNATVNQPPDSPVFDVTAIRNWRRE